MAQFKAFKPAAMERIARSMGYQGDMNLFSQFLDRNPEQKHRMDRYKDKAIQMAKGGYTLKLQEGGDTTEGDTTAPQNLPQAMVKQAVQPEVPTGGAVTVSAIPEADSQFIDEGTGQVGDTTPVDATQANTQTVDPVATKAANKMEATETGPAVDSALNSVQAAQTNPDDPRAKVVAAEQTKTAVGDIKGAKGEAILMDSPNQREIQDGELIDGVANAQKASEFTEQIQAAQATPSAKATVAGQLDSLMQQFEGGRTPPWASGAMRAVAERMAARGLSSSSIEAQAMIQATMESALPIASADASTQARFEELNLSNRQQRAMQAAEQRAAFMGQEFDQAFQARVQNASKIADVANMNFTAEQQVALENSRIANTMNLQNLSNTQALIMAEASSLANLELTSLNNRQQAAVQNSKNFLEMDLANLSNKQQTAVFKAQQIVQSIFNDQAAENAARQFNATSQNQTDQFFANLSQRTKEFNASQTNAQAQFNAGETNAMAKFNAEIDNQRDQYNATNQLQIAQSNAVWRREIATADTAAVNRANELNAKAILDISSTAYSNLWSYYQDTMEFAWKASDNELDRMNQLAIAQLDADAQVRAENMRSRTSAGTALGSLIGTLGTTWMTM